MALLLATSRTTGVLLAIGAFVFLAVAGRVILGSTDRSSRPRRMGRGGSIGSVGDGPDFQPPPDESEDGLD